MISIVRDDQLGLFSSFLDFQETNVEIRPSIEYLGFRSQQARKEFDRHWRGVECQWRPSEPEEIDWRHRGWKTRRDRITQAMMRTACPANRLVRFTECGSDAVVQKCQDTGELRVSSNHCHDRFCVPCARTRSRKIAATIFEASRGRSVRFITLTLRSNDSPLCDQLTRIWTCFARLRERVGWKRAVKGGAAFFEVTCNKNTGRWHPHIHIVAEGTWFDHKSLRDEWLAVTGDSHIVDIRAINSEKDLSTYVTKYVTKGIDEGTIEHPHKLDEAIIALKGRRLCTTFGTWRGIELEPTDLSTKQWTTLARLADLIRSAANGDVHAQDILDRLTSQEKRKDPHVDEHQRAP